MRRVLIDDKLNEEFIRNGFVRVPSFITPREVEELTQKFFETLPQSGGQITAEETGIQNARTITYDFTFIDRNPAYKRTVFEVITEYFRPHMNRLLDNYRPIIANYIRKKTDAGEVPLHQNWAFADERKCFTVSIWCPLVDSTVENGTLQVVPGSHKRFGEIRGPMVPWELDQIKKEIIEKYLVPLETKAGDCVILDDSIVHYSAVNKTNDLRLAIQLICIPAEMPSIHYHMNPARSTDTVEVLEVDVDFYMEFNPWKDPGHAKRLRTLPYKHRYIDEAEFLQRLKQPRFDEAPMKKSWVSKIKEVFS
ncbi:MAG: phytanoyl-CoA dioxygenase family protein [Chitinophagales bacterium]|nr:phytanoyl-CoA dioxygenase family protein [Chitinophagales bacterium]MDW8419190.1 phytanoyl-CoA dioxygenase family protein [Chitinophagales bacterium]